VLETTGTLLGDTNLVYFGPPTKDLLTGFDQQYTHFSNDRFSDSEELCCLKIL